MAATDHDASAELLRAVKQARKEKRALRIRGGGSKDFLGRELNGDVLATVSHHGITAYDPAELVVTVRAGTSVTALSAALAAHRQMLGFEPPEFGGRATVGGTVASGLSGPRRPYAGSARDFVLGLTCITGKAQLLRFGGQVIKNVAGYDLSRLMAGAMGTLAVLCEVSFKVLPLPAAERGLAFSVTQDAALQMLAGWARKPLPLSGAAYHDGLLRIRLSGARSAVDAAAAAMGGDADGGDGDVAWWRQLREFDLPFFTAGGAPLWRVSLPPAARPRLPGDSLVDWGGAQHWLRSEAPAANIFNAAQNAGGHAVRFPLDEGESGGVYLSPLPAALLRLHQKLKTAFDPDGVLNRGRLCAEF
ncbi:MAG: glycolate oxidase subunit GlcE [Gammaproteobacteria bacterium]|nr:glycolate oxidase subunit GlcE [Gammaproteobacteria bacterium]